MQASLGPNRGQRVYAGRTGIDILFPDVPLDGLSVDVGIGIDGFDAVDVAPAWAVDRLHRGSEPQASVPVANHRDL
jgi:hypothetical protein